MWFINFVLIVGTLISLLVFGWATYLEGSRPETKVMSPIAGPVPLPMSRSKNVAQEPVETEFLRQPLLPKQRRTKVRRDL
jgi:hypothetical protein